METLSENQRYLVAKNRAKTLRKFYTHVIIYIFVNILIIILRCKRIDNLASFFTFNTFSTAFYWGIGLAAHALVVYSKNSLFSEAWEERKIKEYLNK
jgi:hypothetical protein